MDTRKINENLNLLQDEIQRLEKNQMKKVKAVLEKDADNFDAQLELADIYARQAVFSEADEPYNKAEELYKNLIKQNPEHHKLYLKLGDLYLNRGVRTDCDEFYPEVYSNYSKALELAPDDKEAYIKLGIFYVVKRVYSKAIDTLMHVIEMDTEFPAFYFLGSVYFARGWYEEAIAAYRASAEHGSLIDIGLSKSQIENVKKKTTHLALPPTTKKNGAEK